MQVMKPPSVRRSVDGHMLCSPHSNTQIQPASQPPMGRSASPLCHRLAIAAGRTAPCLSMRQTLSGVRHPQYAGRQAPARPHRSPRMTPFRPFICFAGHTWTQTHGQRKEGSLWISLSVCLGKISADRELSLQRSLQKTDLRTKTTRLARQLPCSRRPSRRPAPETTTNTYAGPVLLLILPHPDPAVICTPTRGSRSRLSHDYPQAKGQGDRRRLDTSIRFVDGWVPKASG
mmetsp:Transcript_17360/g.49240  ORF Transcript_17360/g.49240 Transcript_17360/m.49240 type:complete len:231 (-) Transcript_17360:542-1234(-)